MMQQYKKVKEVLVLGSMLWVLFSCASVETSNVEEIAKEAGLRALAPIFEKALLAEAPIAPSSRSVYPTVSSLSGKSFDPTKYFNNPIRMSDGILKLLPGDYVVPVMTYCMKSSGSSPEAHRYLIAKLNGSAADIIRDLNTRALPNFDAHEIQAVSWNIQNGIPYEEMGDKNKKIIDSVIPEHRGRLGRSSFKTVVEKWNEISTATGVIPRFENATDELLDRLGEVGNDIKALREFRKGIRAHRNDYESLRSLISLPGRSTSLGTETTTPWSQISEKLYVRFLTSGHFLDLGQLQIRVLSDQRAPTARSAKESSVSVDIGTLIADPGTGNIQPLSFTPLIGGIGIPFISAGASPVLIAAALAALLGAKIIDWDAFEKAVAKYGNVAAQQIKTLIDKGNVTLSKEHDALEKSARDTGILDGATVDANAENKRVRNYTKNGGSDELNRDFEKAPGKEIPTNDPGRRMKELPNGDRIVARTRSDEGSPTLEVQPKNAGKGNKVRVKIRYK